MTESIELRFFDKAADNGTPLAEFFEPREIVRVVDRPKMVWARVRSDRLPQLAGLAQHLSYWEYKRVYSAEEFREAELFQIKWKSFFEPVGEECGTEFNHDSECPECGVGRLQVSDLRLDLRKVPHSAGVACSIASELVVSQDVAEAMVERGGKGVELKPVRHFSSEPSPPFSLESVPAGRELLHIAESEGVDPSSRTFHVWLNRRAHLSLLHQAGAEAGADNLKLSRDLPPCYQLVPTSAPVAVVPPTRFGMSPFRPDDGAQYCCPFGHIAGAYLLSEISIDRSSMDGSDFYVTREYVGKALGLARPHPLYLASKRMLELLIQRRSAVDWEVAHLK